MHALLQCEPAQLKGRRFKLDEDLLHPSGRVQIWEDPVPGRTYAIGADFALGIGRDYDTACVLDKTCEREGLPATQVAEVQGHWGEKFHTILYALITMYNGAFLVGERQFGLPTLRWLWDHYGITYQYREESIDKSAVVEQGNAKLGWPRTADDFCLNDFRRAVNGKRVLIRSAATLDQMAALQWKAKDKDASDPDPDYRLKLKLRTGGSPDLVMAATYAWFASTKCYEYLPQPASYAPGTHGYIDGRTPNIPRQDGVTIHRPRGTNGHT